MSKRFAKRLRKELRAIGFDPNQRELVSKPTQKVALYSFPQGFLPAKAAELANVGGPWYDALLRSLVPIFKRTVINAPASGRAVYQGFKRKLVRDGRTKDYVRGA